MKRLNQNRMEKINWWWGFISNTNDLAFFIDSKTVVIFKNNNWFIREL